MSGVGDFQNLFSKIKIMKQKKESKHQYKPQSTGSNKNSTY